MKKSILFCLCFSVAYFSRAQVSFTILEPASIEGAYEFTSNGDAPNWGLANLNDPMDAVTDTVVLADDGTPGINAQGVPFANEACNPLINNVAGKIVMLYRYDGFSTNDCWASTRILNAQNAGAVGCILVNREDDVYGYNGTPDGPSVTIPFAFISKSDGEIIRDKIDNGDDVVAFIGNKLGLYQNDVGMIKKTTLAPIQSAVLSQTSQNASEFGFDLGTTIYNYGTNTQNNIMLTATVTGAGGTWTESAGPFSLTSGDSIDVLTGGANNINAFSFSNYPDGVYYLDYTIDIGITDSSSFDNTISYYFTVSDSIFSYCLIDTTTNLPFHNTFNRANDPNYAACTVYENDNGSRIGAEGVYTLATMAWNSTNPLEGNFLTAYLYQWDDNFIDLNDANFGFNSLNPLTEGEYFFNPGDDSNMIFIPFDDLIQLDDNQRYLTCIQVWNEEIWLGYNRRIDYNRHVNTYLQAITPVQAGADYFALGFAGGNNTPTMALKVFDEAELSVEESDEQLDFQLYPNPSDDVVFIRSSEMKEGTVLIQDLSGRTILSQSFLGSSVTVDVSNLASGQYIITINESNGNYVRKSFVKI